MAMSHCSPESLVPENGLNRGLIGLARKSGKSRTLIRVFCLDQTSGLPGLTMPEGGQ